MTVPRTFGVEDGPLGSPNTFERGYRPVIRRFEGEDKTPLMHVYTTGDVRRIEADTDGRVHGAEIEILEIGEIPDEILLFPVPSGADFVSGKDAHAHDGIPLSAWCVLGWRREIG